MEKKLYYDKMGKKGLSAIITTLLLVVLVLVMAVLVFQISRDIIDKRLTSSEKCMNIFDNVNINLENTCYDSEDKELQISIDVKDLTVEDIYIIISDETTSKSFKLGTSANFLKEYAGQYGITVSIPGKNSGKTYVVDLEILGVPGRPTSIKIAPVIQKELCSTSDSLDSIGYC